MIIIYYTVVPNFLSFLAFTQIFFEMPLYYDFLILLSVFFLSVSM